MFWVVGDEIKAAPQGTQMSHLEMAEAERWIDSENIDEFFRRNMRSFFLRTGDENRIHFYRGVGFEFDDDVIASVERMLPRFVKELGLSPETRVFFGPKDSVINGVEYPIRLEGTVEELLKAK
jgi:hypothetical protein